MNDYAGDERARPPIAERRSQVTHHHGFAREDDYAWLRADNWQEVMRDPAALNSDIRSYLHAENTFTELNLADTAKLQETLFEEMKGRIKEDDSTVPAPDGAYAYFVKFITGGQHPIFCRRPTDGEAEEILIDGNGL
ncbi:MAG: S9 family peptidase, partial [Methyloligellaceae bacterium]